MHSTVLLSLNEAVHPFSFALECDPVECENLSYPALDQLSHETCQQLNEVQISKNIQAYARLVKRCTQSYSSRHQIQRQALPEPPGPS